MNKSLKSLQKRLVTIFDEGKIKKADLKRLTGFSSSQLEGYLKGLSIPRLDQVDKIAEALGVQPWELLKPENALPTPQPQSPTVEALTKLIADQEKRIQELEYELKKLASQSSAPIKSQTKIQELEDPLLIDFLSSWKSLDHIERGVLARQAKGLAQATNVARKKQKA